MTPKLKATLRLLARWNEHGRPSPAWMLRPSSKCDRRFAMNHASEFRNATTDENFQYVTIDKQPFVWPKNAQMSSLIQLLSELLQTDHPHHYDVEPTPIGPGDLVLDIGACEGAFAAAAASKGAEIVLIEPSGRMREVIYRLFILRNLPVPKIVECLLGEGAGRTNFLDDPDNPGRSRLIEKPVKSSYPMRIRTLDEFALEHLPKRLTYIKCDAEGWDARILMSGRETIKRYRPKIAVTTYHNATDYAVIATYLESLDYRCSGKGLLFSGDAFRTVMLHGVPKAGDR